LKYSVVKPKREHQPSTKETRKPFPLDTSTMSSSTLNDKAKRLRNLCKPGDPLLLTNVYDAGTASIVANHEATKAIATASFAIAGINGLEDSELTLEQNLAGIRQVSAIAEKHDLPLTVDLQDCYDNVKATITLAIEAGAVGCNIEDADNRSGELRSINDAVSRIKAVKAAAEEAGVPDFCINARTDILTFKGSIDEAIERGKAYLEAGAVTVFVWGRERGVSRDEVKQLVAGLNGMVNVKMNLRPGALNAAELAEIGVARISIGPELYMKAMAGFREALNVAVQRKSF
jgi:2-methylisocitrate lyase-like PEP mutase family enzyme